MSDWVSYDWELSGQPAVFHADLTYVEEFDTLGDFTTLLYVSCFSRREGATAFSAREKRLLPRVLDECMQELSGKAVFVGFIDVLAQRRYYFYTSDARLLVPLMHVCTEQKHFRVECTKAAEPNRQTYYRLLVPDASKRQSVDNRAYLETLLACGDDPEAMRRVNLHMQFPSAQARGQFMRFAKAEGFALGDEAFIAEQELPYAVTVHSVSQLTLPAVTSLTSSAIGIAETCGGRLAHFDSAFVPKHALLR